MKNAVIKIGDIHGNFPWLVEFMRGQEDGTTFIQVGDFGLYIYKKALQNEFLQQLNRELGTRNQKLFVIRGNHDDPAHFNGDLMLGNVNLVPDYHVEEIEGARYLFIGGATSIDRKQNTVGVDYWPNEGFVADFEKIRDLSNINVVITHTAPQEAHPQRMTQIVHHFAQFDPQLIGDLKRERLLVTGVFQEIVRNNPGLTEWWYGHFHHPYSEYIGWVKFRLLNVQEAAE